MSMQMQVYVGPFANCVDCDRELLEQFDEVADGRGELGVDEILTYVVPNVNLFRDDSACRQMEFSRHEPLPVISIDRDRQQLEMEAFVKLSEPFVQALEASGGSCSFHFGVVCRWF